MNKWLVLILPLLMLTTAWAEETVKVEELVVTALRAEEEIEKLPSNVTVITEEDIKDSTATTVQDMLREEEGLVVRDFYGTGTRSAVDMRGFARGLDTAILVDGRKVNEVDLSGVDWNLIPLEDVERIEIVRGGGSVLYGDNAMGGVINIITKKGATPKPQIDIGARLESYGGNSEHITVRGATERLSYSFFGKYRETDGYRVNSEFRAEDLGANLTLDLSDSFYVSLRAKHHKDHQGLPGGLTEAEVAQDRRQTANPDDGVDYDQYHLGLEVGYSPVDWAEINLGYSFNNREYDSRLVGLFFGVPFSSATVRDTDTEEIKLKFTSRHKLFNRKNLLVAGVDCISAKVNNDNDFTFFGTSTTITDLKKRELGLYVQDELFLSEKLSLVLGYRYTDAKYEDVVSGASTGSGSQDFSEQAVKSGVTYNYAPGAKLFASYSRGFRLPTTDELFSFTGTVTLLRPEKSDTFELGIVHSFGEDLQARVTLYHMDVEGELFLNPAGGGGFGANENADSTVHQGVEFGLNSRFGERVSVDGSWTYSSVKFDSGQYDGKTIPLVPEQTASLGAAIKLTEAARLSLNALWVGSRFIVNDLDNALDKLAPYTKVDARFACRHKNFEAYVGVNNIFDKHYSEYAVVGSSGKKGFYPAPERNFYGGMKLVF